jgi:hypothetical protein
MKEASKVGFPDLGIFEVLLVSSRSYFCLASLPKWVKFMLPFEFLNQLTPLGSL